MTTRSPERDVMHVAYINAAGERVVVGEHADPQRLSSFNLPARRQMARKVLGFVHGTLAKFSGARIEGRTITGYDDVIDSGLLAGAPLRLKGQVVPLHVTNETDWYPVEL